MANGSIGDIPAATFAELLSGPMIDVYVGEAKRHWSLHRNLLCHHSELLESELEGDGKNTKRKEKLELPEYDPAGFELLVKWLYQGKLDDVSDMIDANQKYEYAVSCHKLYLLCDRLDMPQLKNVAMDQYRKGLHQAELVPDADEIDQVYRQSPAGSPFRKLMTRIAARQIMDPGHERDIETYRQCFDNNPDFAIDLIKAIRGGSGGVLFDDPTEMQNPCEYHDHEDGPNCHIKGKGRAKQTRKTPAPRIAPPSTRSTPSTNSVQQSHPLHLSPMTPRLQAPHQARPQDRASAGPLRRRLTSPAISTVGTSPETATGSLPPSLYAAKDMEKWKNMTLMEGKNPSTAYSQILGETRMMSRPAPGEPLPSLEGTSRPLNKHGKERVVQEDEEHDANGLQQILSRRGLWDWARAGTGRLNIIGQRPHPEWRRGPIYQDSRTNVSVKETIQETQDDFCIPSTTVTDPNDTARQRLAEIAKLEGLGIVHASITSPSFAQTKQSSDELIATASSTGSPAWQQNTEEHWTNGKSSTPFAASEDSPLSTPDTPTPQQRRKNILNDVSTSSSNNTSPTSHTISTQPTNSQATSTSNNTSKACAKTRNSSTSHPVPKYKIALAQNLLSHTGNTIALT